MGNIVLGVAWVLGGIFAVAGLLDMVAPGTVADFYRHLGIAPPARLLFGLVKLATAMLLFIPGFGLGAAALGIAAGALSLTLFVLDQRFRLAGLTMAMLLALVTTAAFEL